MIGDGKSASFLAKRDVLGSSNRLGYSVGVSDGLTGAAANSASVLPSLKASCLFPGFNVKPGSVPIIIGSWPASPSVKKPTTISPSLRAYGFELFVGNMGVDQGSELVGTCILLSACQPTQRTRSRPSFKGSCLSSTNPINQIKPPLPTKSFCSSIIHTLSILQLD